MPDPDPVVLLPEAEYIELYNTSENTVAAAQWSLSANNRWVELPSFSLNSGEYLLLADIQDIGLYGNEIHKKGIESFPVLSNPGATLLLRDGSGRLMHTVTYEDKWHSDDAKKEGGWSLEMINPREPCLDRENWVSTENYRGGTPGEVNSVYDETTDDIPELWRVAVAESNVLQLYFSESLDSMTTVSGEYYIVDHGLGNPSEVMPAWPDSKSVELRFDKEFEPNTEYKIQLTSDICDCSGNTLLQPARGYFRVPANADSADIIINEVMYEPDQGFVEFIELYNTSTNTIDLVDFRISVGDPSGSEQKITEEYWPLHAGEYAVIADDYSGLDDITIFSRAEKIIHMPDMPALPNSGNQIYLYKDSLSLSDIVLYTPESHHKILTETKGVALERVSQNTSGLDSDNWLSASADAGFMTPARINSQLNQGKNLSEVSLSSKTLSPNDDGLEDMLTIRYQLEQEGYMGQVFIFNDRGSLVYRIADGVLLGAEGVFDFNGRDEEGKLLPMGFYIVYFNAYHTIMPPFVRKLSFVLVRE